MHVTSYVSLILNSAAGYGNIPRYSGLLFLGKKVRRSCVNLLYVMCSL